MEPSGGDRGAAGRGPAKIAGSEEGGESSRRQELHQASVAGAGARREPPTRTAGVLERTFTDPERQKFHQGAAGERGSPARQCPAVPDLGVEAAQPDLAEQADQPAPMGLCFGLLLAWRSPSSQEHPAAERVPADRGDHWTRIVGSASMARRNAGPMRCDASGSVNSLMSAPAANAWSLPGHHDRLDRRVGRRAPRPRRRSRRGARTTVGSAADG